MSKPNLIGVNRNLALFESRGRSVVVNTRTLTAALYSVDDAKRPDFVRPSSPVDPIWVDIAEAALRRETSPTSLTTSQSMKRTYTVPKRVVETALSADHVSGLRTPVAEHMSNLLASGGQVSCEDVLWMSRFFDNHQEDATDRATWLSWGGREGQRWAGALATRLDYDSVVADAGAYETPGVQDFVDGDETERCFYALLDQELGQNAVALFKQTAYGTWQAWGNGDWLECESPELSARFVPVDDDCALYLAGALFDAPDTPIDLRSPNPEAWDLAQAARDEIDWTLVDRAMLAAGAPARDYTPEERAQNASKQIRDANGRFAEVGARGAVKSTGIGGVITHADEATGIVTVQGDDKNTYQIPAADFEVGADPHPKADPEAAKDAVDFAGILSPDVVAPEPRATLTDGAGPVLGPVQIKSALEEYTNRVTEERQARSHEFDKIIAPESEINESIQAAGELPATGDGSVPTDPAQDVPPPSPDPTPDETDVAPIYLAIVDRDDPRSVMELVSLVPATATSSEPKTFRRSGGSWVEDQSILQDMRSATPPPIVQLDADQYKEVLAQVDMETTSPPDGAMPSEEQTITAASGGWDRNRGNAETLRRYWTHGEGAAKIRWGTHGDFDRCVRLLSKYLGPRAKGYCNLRHKDAIGIYPPTHAKNERSLAIDESVEPILVDSPQHGDKIMCPGCDQEVTFDEMDGPQAADGSVSHDDGTTHSDYIIVTDVPEEIADGMTRLGEADDEEYDSLVAAGGLDRNRGNAEELRRYWTVGAGGLKIRWNTGGDWTRCVRLLSKYLGPRAKGYCALRHKEMTGMWPGDRRNRELAGYSLTAAGQPVYSTDELRTLPAVLRASADFAAYEVAKAKVFGNYEHDPVPQSPEDISDGRSGRAFSIPLVIPEGLATGDGRTFSKGSLGMRTLPLPLLWQIHTGDGHDGAVLVGRIDRVERTKDGLGNAYGVFDTGPYGREAQRLVESGMLRWISADLDKFEVDQDLSNEDTGKLVIKKGRLMGATLVPKPAFQECTIELVPLEENEMFVDAEPSAISASASIANAIPVEPPSTWFERPVLNGPTPITVTDEGQVFGHIATWDRDHIGMAGQVRAPRSASNYAYFHTGVVRTNDGKDVRVGQLTLAGGHAPIHLDAASAVRHYDDTASAIADVHAGEDSYGVWVAGALRPGATPEQIRALRASAPSGDWRAINHRLELVAVCQVNVPGFPVPRSMTASGALTSLVAAGVAPLIEMRAEQSREEQEALVAAARTRLFRALDVDGYLTEFKSFSPEKRDALAKEGKALPDGSFPIENVADLRRAVHAYGRAEESKKAKVRRHIVKRARGLDRPDLIPSQWKEASMSEKSLSQRDRYDALVASTLSAQVEELKARVCKPSKNKDEDLAAQVEELRSRIQKRD